MAFPLSETNIRVLSGVPFSNDYKHTRWFTSATEQFNYFNGRNSITTLQNYKPMRIENSSQVTVKVKRYVEGLRNANYCMFQNESKWFYAFITRVEYISADVTELHMQIDVIQTWMFQLDFKPSYVQREHAQLWQPNGHPVVNTIDEGLAYGTEYETVSIQNYVPYGNIFYLVICSKSSLHGAESDGTTPNPRPSINGIVQPLCYYIHPFYLDGTSPSITGGGYPLTNVQELLESLYTNENAINNIVSLYITDFIGVTPTVEDGTLTFDDDQISPQSWADDDQATDRISTLWVKEIIQYNSKTDSMGDKYSSFNEVDESKLLMYPYAFSILEDYKGNRAIIKNEFVNGTNLNITVRGSLGTTNKVAYSVRDYLVDDDMSNADQLRVSLEHSLINNNPNDVPILTDLLSAYLQGNKNSLENQREQIVFNGAISSISSAIGGVASARTMNATGVLAGATGVMEGAGSAILQIQGIDAKLQDINNLPPQLTKMGSNTAFDYGNRYLGMYLVKKQIKEEYRTMLSGFFKMYGYKCSKVKIPNLRTRMSFNFVQTVACTILASINNDELNTIKSAFDNGITLWHTDDVGNYDLGNGVRS